MNIYQKKIVKEKEFIFNEDCIPTKSTNINSQPNMDFDIKPNISIRQFYDINFKKAQNIGKNNRQHKSKSLILSNKGMIENNIPKEIKTFLIQLKKPLNENNNNNSDYIKHKTYYTNKFYDKKRIQFNNMNNELKNFENISTINQNPNIINIDNSFEKKDHNTNYFPFYLPYQESHKKNNKHARNKSAFFNKEEIRADNISMNSSLNTIYKKSFCVDKHKNHGGNFKNKERSKTNSFIKPIKNNDIIKSKKNLIVRNTSAPNIHNLINIQDLITSNYYNNCNTNKNIIKNLNKNDFHNIINNCNDDYNNKYNNSKIQNINLQYNYSSVDKDKNNNINKNDLNNENKNKEEKEYYKNKEIYKNKEESSLAKNKFKMKKIPPLNFKNINIKNSTNIVEIDSKDNLKKGFYNKKTYNKHINTSQIKVNKNNNNMITFEEPKNDLYSMKNHSNSKRNLINLINISERQKKTDKQFLIPKNGEISKINKYINKIEKNKSNIKVKNNNKNTIPKKVKEKKKIKGKIFRTNSAQKIETENNPNNNNINKIKSIPLKLNNINDMHICSQNYNNYINIPRNIGYNLLNNNKINTNIIVINEKDLSLWNDLTRIYNFNGKY